MPSSEIPSTSSTSTDEPTTSSSRGITLTRTPRAFSFRVVSSNSSESSPRGAMIARSIRWERTTDSSVAPLPFAPLEPFPFEGSKRRTRCCGQLPITRAFRPGAWSKRRWIHSVVSASPRTRQRSSGDLDLAIRRATARIAIMLSSNRPQTPTA